MIDFYTWPTPNGHKVAIMLEETALAYNTLPIDIQVGEQFDPKFMAISPNHRIPAIVDNDGPGGKPISIFESGAILIYLAEKTGQFMPTDPSARMKVLEWLMFQMGNVGPMFGQCNHFRSYAPEEVPYAVNRYTKEVGRLYGVMDKQLGRGEYLAGEYSIADIATFSWTLGYKRYGYNMDDYPNVKRWQAALTARPGVSKGMDLLSEKRRTGGMSDDAKKVLFGDQQYQRR